MHGSRKGSFLVSAYIFRVSNAQECESCKFCKRTFVEHIDCGVTHDTPTTHCAFQAIYEGVYAPYRATSLYLVGAQLCQSPVCQAAFALPITPVLPYSRGL